MSKPTEEKVVYIVLDNGIVEDVLNLPPGWESHVLDLSTCDKQADEDAVLYEELRTKYTSESFGNPTADPDDDAHPDDEEENIYPAQCPITGDGCPLGRGYP